MQLQFAEMHAFVVTFVTFPCIDNYYVLNYILKQHNGNKSQNNEVPIFKDLSRLLFKYLVYVQRKN